MKRIRTGSVVGLLVLLLVCAGCSGGGGEHKAPEPAAAPTETAATPQSKEERYAEHKRKYLEAYSKQDFPAAAAEAEAAIQDDPTNREPYMLLSKAWIDAGNENEPLLAFTNLAKEHPDRPEAWFFLGFHHARRKAWEPAKDALERAVALAPNDAEAHYRLGLVLAETGGSKAALPSLRKAVELDPESPGKQSSLMVALHEVGLDAEANSMATSLLARAPESGEAHYAVARLRMAQGKLAETEKELRKTVELAPDFTYAKSDLEALLVQTGKAKPAAASSAHGTPAPAKAPN